MPAAKGKDGETLQSRIRFSRVALVLALLGFGFEWLYGHAVTESIIRSTKSMQAGWVTSLGLGPSQWLLFAVGASGTALLCCVVSAARREPGRVNEWAFVLSLLGLIVELVFLV